MDPAETFQLEAADLLQELETTLLALDAIVEQWAAEPQTTADLVARSFRALHTLKGSGSMFGPPRLVEFAHVFETVFDQIRNGAITPDSTMMGVFLRSIDHLRTLLDESDPVDEAVNRELTTSLQAALSGRSSDCGPAAEENRQLADKGEAGSTCYHAVRLQLAADSLAHGTRPDLLIEELRAAGRAVVVCDPTLIPDLEDLEPQSLYLVWYILIADADPVDLEFALLFVADMPGIRMLAVPPTASADLAAWLHEALDGPETLMKILASHVEIASMSDDDPSLCEDDKGRMESDREASSQTRSAVTADAKGSARRDDPAASTLRISASRLDTLMDQVGELVIAQARLAQLAHGRRDAALSAVSEEIQRLAAELRDSTMSMRMLPIGSVFGRFRRVVRDLSAELEKEVELVTAGEDTELDKTVLERLTDPLIHLIRNSVDHGLETADARERAGKPACGTVRLSAQQMAGEVIIEIEDDGRGLNTTAIRERAVERGLIDADADLPDGEIHMLIFEPGFSTAAAITNISGRGVGMDVVKRTIDELRGTVSLVSLPGRGSRIELRLPLTLAIIDGLLVRVGRNRFVLPLPVVEECVELDFTIDREARGRCMLSIRDELVPFLRLHEAFGLKRDKEREQKVVIVRSGFGRVGLVVDQVVGQHQTVVKTLSVMHRGIRGLGGATILGDGSVALIIDIGPLVMTAHERSGLGLDMAG